MSIKNTIPLFFAVDDSYAPYLSVSLTSIKENTSPDSHITAHILYSSLTKTNIEKLSTIADKSFEIKFFDVNVHIKKIKNSLHTRDYYSSATYYRFLIPHMFPKLDKGLYLDCDVVLRNNIEALYNTDLEDFLVGAVTDEVVTDIPLFSSYSEEFLGISPKNYFNAGVMLLNLKKMRQLNILEALESLMSKCCFPVAQDQDYLNILCGFDVKYLPLEWNKTAFDGSDKLYSPNLIHFKLNFKPWHYDNIAFENIFWKYAKKTPYFEDLKNEQLLYGFEEKERDRKGYEHLISLAQREIKKASMPGYTPPIKYSLKRMGI